MLLLVSSPSESEAQYFGQNKVNYDTFEWYYLRTENLKIYHPKDSYEIAEFTAWAAEESFQQICDILEYTPENRITIVVYPSHNTFTETNVSFGIQGESTGGFTEFLKNRVVIPYEGSYEKFRHVIHHELTHAVMMRMIYGEGMGSIITGIYRMPLPLWFIEGMAEYTSRFGWGNEADMYMRDAVYNDYLPPIRGLGGYFYYKGGQSIMYYIDQRYGTRKIGELLNRVRTTRDLGRALKISIGVDQEELSKRWHKYLKKEIWPSAVNFESPSDFAEQITDHEDWYNFVNNSPALSPDGDKMVFLSNKDDYFSLYLMSTVSGKIEKRLVKGETNDLFEQLHWLRPGIDWSPDSRQITFAAKAGSQDAIYTLNVESEEITNQFTFEIQGVFSPVWSPDGKYIAFAGHKNGQSDIYIVSLKVGEKGKFWKVTDDIYSDFDPAWSPDGKTLLFTSDRGAQLNPKSDDKKIWSHNYPQVDLYAISLENETIKRLTDDEYEDRTPKWSPRENIISFVSDRAGAYNLYLMDMETGESWAITNILTGAFQPSWSNAGTVAFACFFNAGYDIYLYKNPFDPSRRVEPDLTGYQQKERSKEKVDRPMVKKGDKVKILALGKSSENPMRENERSMSFSSDDDITDKIQVDTTNVSEDIRAFEEDDVALIDASEGEPAPSDSLKEAPDRAEEEEPKHTPEAKGVRLVSGTKSGGDPEPNENPYRNYVFEPAYYNDDYAEKAKEDTVAQGPLVDEEGNLVQKKYKIKFTPDIVNATAGYSTFFGLQGMGQILFSDVLGNHLIFLTTDLYYSFENSNFSFYYYLLKNRLDYGGGAFHNVYFFNLGRIRDRNFGASFNLQYPLSRYRRFEFSTAFVNIDRDVWSDQDLDYKPRERRHFVLPEIAYVSDNTVWGYTGPMNGRRFRVGFAWSPKLQPEVKDETNIWGFDFKTLALDARQYFHVGRDYSFAIRLAGATSFGEHPQTFFMGGVNNWINRRFATGNILTDVDDVYFSSFATPLRGVPYYARRGNNYALQNTEFRFPLIRQMLFGWPLPLFFYNIRGALFLDVGAAWGGEYDTQVRDIDSPTGYRTETVDNKFRLLAENENGKQEFASLAAGYGWGFRVNMGMFLLKWDVAWEHTYDYISKPRYYVSLGTDF
ncbi:DPP IV N-terminal domain-containing protein [bacterium]|nr:DPP IV N-terminal domain-containing protein [bacterium]